mmetsp:Transcript_1368/g.4230  ORF Transcript_1368/g.4230 Transcript_1368/m.4230 type:complete len:234 (-) Transcript_1368:204-905(-)
MPSRASSTCPASSQARRPLHTEPAPLGQVLVTPKLSFALRLQPGWKRASDIEEDALRLAFLARFPVKLRAEHLTFRCATPAASLETGTLVYRIGAADVSEDRVLLSVLSELDKSYTAKFEAALERARADCLSASNCFQVVADEVRTAQEATSRRWESEVRSLKETQGKSQKRLFLLEQERDQLRDQLLRATTSSKRAVSELRTSLGGLAEENASLRRVCLDAVCTEPCTPTSA